MADIGAASSNTDMNGLPTNVTCMYVCMYVFCVYLYVCVCIVGVYMYVRVCVCMLVCVCVYICV